MSSTSFRSQTRRRVLMILFILALALSVRVLTANFLRAHFDDPGWFQFGSYAVFDRQAQAVLDGKESFFWIPDSSRTDLIQYPPGYRVWMAVIYGITGERSAASVQRAQLVLDSLCVLLIVGIGTTAYNWGVGMAAGTLAALSPWLALGGATPTADAPASWFVLAAVWCLLLSVKRQGIAYAISSGALLGLACWLRVNPLFLVAVWAGALILFTRVEWRRRLILSAALSFSTLLVVSPVVIRNLVVFYPEVAPTGLNIGLNLWEGIGETERGEEFGVPSSDQQVVDQDRKEMGLPADAPLGLNFPDGIRRDKERGRRAMTIIRSHPLWFTGVMVRRVWGHLKFAGKPVPHVGSAGFNVTSRKCLPPDHQGGVLALSVNVLGMIQSVWRYLALPLMLFGLFLSFRKDWRTTGVLLATVFYYLATLAVGHSEIRYGLPMQAILILFAGVAVYYLATLAGPLSGSRLARGDNS
jgi:hypothetical protein